MSLEPIRREVILALAQTNEALRDARHALADGDDRQKVEAAGEIDFLGRYKAMLEQRLGEIDWRMAGHRTFFAWFRQAWFNLMLHFESWIAHG